jgi:hypothetical protein
LLQSAAEVYWQGIASLWLHLCSVALKLKDSNLVEGQEREKFIIINRSEVDIGCLHAKEIVKGANVLVSKVMRVRRGLFTLKKGE